MLASKELPFTSNAIESLVAYPNPFENKIFLKDLDYSKVQSVQLIDFLGKEIDLNMNWDEMSLELNGSAQSSGVYFLKIGLTTGESKIIKLLKS
jgi:hypothetical protein